jgi:hypothetical protein
MKKAFQKGKSNVMSLDELMRVVGLAKIEAKKIRNSKVNKNTPNDIDLPKNNKSIYKSKNLIFIFK